MKKRINLTIDGDLYDDLEYLPRKISVSEVTNLLLKAFIAEVKKGHELTDKEVKALADSIGDGTLRERMQEQWGPKFDKIDQLVNGVKKRLKLDGKKK
jgi:hypothetical protein